MDAGISRRESFPLPTPWGPTSLNTLSGSAAQAAASHRDKQTHTAYARVEATGCSIVPFSVELYGCLGQPAMKLLHLFGDEAAGPGGVSRASFVAGAMRELSVELIRGNFLSCCIVPL
jgi:hypothetical protein